MLYVEVAETPRELETGLMFRKDLKFSDGMLFKFPDSRVVKFWGRNTYLPLDIAFISDDDKIVKISKIPPLSRDEISSDSDCKMAIEANDGYFLFHNISVGDKVVLDKDKFGTIVLFEKKEG